MSRHYKRLSPLDIDTVWAHWARGQTAAQISDLLGCHDSTVSWVIGRAGGLRPQPRSRAARTLTLAEREEISRGLAAGDGVRALARRLGRAPSTISREIKRNRAPNGYWPKAAMKKARRRLRQRALANVRQSDPAAWDFARHHLALQWSPEQIAGALRRAGGATMSHETVYRRLYAEQRCGGQLWTHLRRAHRRRYRRRCHGLNRRLGIVHRVGIEQRPAVVASRSRIGDWEGDTVIGAGQQQALVTWVERRSGYLLMARVTNKTAAAVSSHSIALLKPYAQHVQTLTTDNGREFVQHQRLASELQAAYYFADPYASWQRGTNENTNGLIRQYFPKQHRFATITDAQVREVMERLNHRPRKRLHYRSPHEVFMQEILAVALRP